MFVAMSNVTTIVDEEKISPWEERVLRDFQDHYLDVSDNLS